MQHVGLQQRATAREGCGVLMGQRIPEEIRQSTGKCPCINFRCRFNVVQKTALTVSRKSRPLEAPHAHARKAPHCLGVRGWPRLVSPMLPRVRPAPVDCGGSAFGSVRRANGLGRQPPESSCTVAGFRIAYPQLLQHVLVILLNSEHDGFSTQ